MTPRPEYPRPQFVRERWLNLNGPWEFADDPGDSGLERGLAAATPYPDTILVPFCRESKLSGLERTDRCAAVWYRRTVTLPAEWAGCRVLLHFGAADYETTVWANGQEAGHHRGGHSSFRIDLSPWAVPGREVVLCVRCRDDWRSLQPRGKQSVRPLNSGCHYTRTTGIWQTVWLEPVPASRLERPRITPCVGQGQFQITQRVTEWQPGQRLRAALSYQGLPLTRAESAVGQDFHTSLTLPIPPEHLHLWNVGQPRLYDITLELADAAGRIVDRATTYAGLRAVSLQGNRFLLNGRPVFQRLVLDQGYYPDGILTAPCDAALARDIELALAAGFNGARLHKKVFEERFLHHADRLGYLAWGEFPDWCQSPHEHGHACEGWDTNFVTEWMEVLERDCNHPSIIGWCPMNEQMQREGGEAALETTMRALFMAAHLADPTRPVLDVSGWSHRLPETDIYDMHDYAQDPETLRANTLCHSRPGHGANWPDGRPHNIPYLGQPFFISEFGGIQWPVQEGTWGYGTAPKNLEEFYQRFAGLCRVLLEHEGSFGYCYTQLTDVFQECNGIYHFDRSEKFSLEPLRAAQTRPAACETPL